MVQENNLQIHSSFIANVSLSKEPVNLSLKRNEVHIWKISVHDHFHDLFKKYRFVLSNQEYAKARAYHWMDDVRRHLASKMIQKLLFGKYLSKSPAAIEFVETKGKPSLVGKLPLNFNLSYTDKIILISVGLCETGIDVEKIRHNFDYKELLSACFSKKEREYITYDSNKSRDEFFLQWTRKEALLKYTGQGIIDDLSIVPSLNGIHKSVSKMLSIGSNLCLTSFKMDSDHVVSLVYPSTVTEVKYFEWQ